MEEFPHSLVGEAPPPLYSSIPERNLHGPECGQGQLGVARDKHILTQKHLITCVAEDSLRPLMPQPAQEVRQVQRLAPSRGLWWSELLRASEFQTRSDSGPWAGENRLSGYGDNEE